MPGDRSVIIAELGVLQMPMNCRKCEKKSKVNNCRKGLWSPEEDEKLKSCINKHGLGNWSCIPAKAGLQRNGKSCRLRWLNYLRPGLNHDTFSSQEVETIVKLQSLLGNKWSLIAKHLLGRTDNEVKNYWNSNLRNKIMKGGESLKSPFSSSKLPQCTSQFSFSACLESMEPSTKEPTQPERGVEESAAKGGRSQQLSFPKILFTDWISMEHPEGQNPMQADEGMSSNWACSMSSTDVSWLELLQASYMPSDEDLIREFGVGEFRSHFNHGETVFDAVSGVETSNGFQMSQGPFVFNN
ncbi:transcription factor LAF1-like [Zingiber officinale]|nr:transcription factor LAF1-like [Zingiber officinale]